MIGQVGSERFGGIPNLMPAILLALSYLLPVHEPPWVTFQAEVSVALSLAICIRYHLVTSWRGAIAVPTLSLGVAAAALVPLLHFYFTGMGYLGDSVMAALYLAAFAASIMVGASASFHESGDARRITIAVIVAAVVSGAIGVGQVVAPSLDVPGLLVPANRSGRALGNLAQPNLLATLLLLGLVGTACSLELKILSRVRWLLLSAFLVIALACTQSRTGAAIFIALTGLALIRPWGHTKGATGLPVRKHLLILLAVFTISLSSVSWLRTADAPTEQAAPKTGILDASSTSARFSHWRTLGIAVAANPLVGYGWNQTAVAQGRFVEAGNPPHEFIEHAHNLLLDLWVWNGLLLGSALILGGCLLLHRACKAVPASAPQGRYAIAAICVMGTHAMVEFPLDFLLFLIPLGLLVGSQFYRRAEHRTSIPAPLLNTFVFLCMGVGVLVSLEYRDVRTNLAQARQLLVSGSPSFDLSVSERKVLLLTQLQAQLDLLKALHSGRPPASWQNAEVMSLRFGYPPVLVRLAQRAKADGEPELAERVLSRLCATAPAKICLAGRSAVQ